MAYNKYYLQKRQVSYDNGLTWEDVTPSETRQGAFIDSYETLSDCEGGYNFKMLATYSDDTTYQVDCNSSTELTSTETNGHSSAFTSMTSVIIGDCVTTVGRSAFDFYNNNTMLTSVTISDSVTELGTYAFYHCSGLTSIVVPSSVVNLNSQTFNGCSSLQSITFESLTPPGVTSTNFLYDTNNCPIYVPAQSVEAYKGASGWSTYADRIQAIP